MKPSDTLHKLEAALTAELAFRAMLTIGLVGILTFVLSLFVVSDPFIGGDFIAFWSAAKTSLAGDMSTLYGPNGLSNAIVEHAPDLAQDKTERLTWQYPPISTLAFSPIGLMPFPLAFTLVILAGLIAYTAALRTLQIEGKFLIAVLCTPIVYSAWVTGQNGLFTGSLFICTIVFVDKRPVLAGLAAALLTLKPQLGLLIPLAFIAGRHWVPFFTAAGASLLLWAGAFVLTGTAPWLAFMEGIQSVSGAVQSGQMPLFKMTTLFAALRLVQLPTTFALVGAISFGLVIAAGICWIWRTQTDTHIRLASMTVASLMVAPYAYFYELTITLPAALLLAQNAERNGWLRGERLCMSMLVLLSLVLPGPALRSGIPLGFIWLCILTACLARRFRAVSAPSTSTHDYTLSATSQRGITI